MDERQPRWSESVTMPTMLDLFSGRGGASRAMVERGWHVTTVDNDPQFAPDIVADVTGLEWTTPVDLLWASPPCTEFSRESMPWCATGMPPDVSLVSASLRVIDMCSPRFWVLENVRGAVRYLEPLLGVPAFRTGPVYLWGKLPPGLLPVLKPWKEKITGEDPARRAELPYELSYAIATAVERASRNGVKT